MLIYKILRPAEWDAFDSSERFDGSPDDFASGFVHCSSREQVAATAQRFFTDEPLLIVVAVDAEALEDPLRWELASNGDSFPHVYGSIPRTAVVSVHRVPGATRVDEILGSI